MRIIRDSKEQQPWAFKDYVYDQNPVIVGRDSLEAGDYTIAAHDMPNDDNSNIIERKKDCRELCTNLGQKWEQFENEARLLQKYTHKFIVVCGPDNFEYLYDRGYTKLHPNFIYSRLAYLAVTYNLPTMFFANRENAENFVFRTFVKILQSTT